MLNTSSPPVGEEKDCSSPAKYIGGRVYSQAAFVRALGPTRHPRPPYLRAPPARGRPAPPCARTQRGPLWLRSPAPIDLRAFWRLGSRAGRFRSAGPPRLLFSRLPPPQPAPVARRLLRGPPPLAGADLPTRARRPSFGRSAGAMAARAVPPFGGPISGPLPAAYRRRNRAACASVPSCIVRGVARRLLTALRSPSSQLALWRGVAVASFVGSPAFGPIVLRPHGPKANALAWCSCSIVRGVARPLGAFGPQRAAVDSS